jgi:hypothetical protein
MPELVIDLPPNLYELLRSESDRTQKPIARLAQEYLLRLLNVEMQPTALNEREQVREVFRAAGFIAELSDEEEYLAASSTATLEEVQTAFAHAGGQSLSEIVIEQRGPKV